MESVETISVESVSWTSLLPASLLPASLLPIWQGAVGALGTLSPGWDPAVWQEITSNVTFFVLIMIVAKVASVLWTFR